MKKILVIDDDRMIGEMLKYMFTFKGYQVWVTPTPDGTTHNILENNIDLVLLDKFLDGVDGTEVCATLKNNQTTAHVPVIMMSANSEVKSNCLSAGATAFVSKPFELKSLFEKIEAVLAKAF